MRRFYLKQAAFENIGQSLYGEEEEEEVKEPSLFSSPNGRTREKGKYDSNAAYLAHWGFSKAKLT